MIRPSPTELTVGDLGPTIVLSPHPDDESLAVGATLAALARNGTDVRLVLASAGERSHPKQPPEQVRRVRAAEFAAALRVLGLPHTCVVELALPDRAVDDRDIAAALEQLNLSPDATVIAPSLRDGHRDHRACARASRHVTAGTHRRLLTYQVWPSTSTTSAPAPTGRRWVVTLMPELRAQKAAALACYPSQLVGTPPVVPDALVRRALAGPEMFTEERP